MEAAGEPQDHVRFDGLALQHVLGGLDDTDGQRFRAHLVQCGHCRARVGELRAIAHELADVERDEERARAARQLETKRRDETAERPTAQPRRRPVRGGQAAIVALLLVVTALAAWNFFLRSAVVELEQQLDAVLEASRTLEAGRAWDIDSAAGIDAEVREDEGALVIVIEGLADGSYVLEVLGEDGELLEGQEAVPSDGRVFLVVPELAPEAAQVRLLPEGDEHLAPLVEAFADS